MLRLIFWPGGPYLAISNLRQSQKAVSITFPANGISMNTLFDASIEHGILRTAACEESWYWLGQLWWSFIIKRMLHLLVPICITCCCVHDLHSHIPTCLTKNHLVYPCLIVSIYHLYGFTPWNITTPYSTRISLHCHVIWFCALYIMCCLLSNVPLVWTTHFIVFISHLSPVFIYVVQVLFHYFNTTLHLVLILYPKLVHICTCCTQVTHYSPRCSLHPFTYKHLSGKFCNSFLCILY